MPRRTTPQIVVLGVSPTRAETGYGYIEQGTFVDPDPSWVGCDGLRTRRVKRLTEKPDPDRAAEFLTSGNYAWNSGIFLWSAKTLTGAIRGHCPAIAPHLEKIGAANGTPEFAQVYAQCQNIPIDYAVLEPRSAKGELVSEIYCLPADFGWNDLGLWASVHEHQGGAAGVFGPDG